MITTFLRIGSILYRSLKKRLFQLSTWFNKLTYQLFYKTYAVSINHDGSVLMVVARYNENVDWCKSLDIPYVIYNKGKNDLSDEHPVVNLPNVGREGHTYLHYLISNFHNLPDRIIFTQGSPFVHSPTFLDDISKHALHLPVQPLSIRYLPAFDPTLKHLSAYETGMPSEAELTNCPFYFRDIPFFVHQINERFEATWPAHYVDPVISTFNHVRDYPNNSLTKVCELIDIPKPETCYFNYAAILSVSKQNILNRPIATYKNAMRFVLSHSQHVYLMERMWLTLFDFKAPE